MEDRKRGNRPLDLRASGRPRLADHDPLQTFANRAENSGQGANWQLISRRGVLLSQEESAAALAVPVRPVDVYGQSPLSEEEKQKVYVPSRGFPMSFGRRAFETRDGEHFLYLLQLDGDAAAVIGEPPHTLTGKVVVKVGLAKDPDDRCAQHNSGLPPAGKLRWKLALRSKALPDGNSALAAETSLKETFAGAYRSLGGEFFLCDEKTVGTAFIRAAVKA